MPDSNLFQDLKKVLQDFKNFLDANVAILEPAIRALSSIIPQITDLLDKLIDLMGKLRTEIQNLNVAAIPGLSQVSAFAAGVKTLLPTAGSLLPAEKSTIDTVLSDADVVESLAGLDQVKNDILSLIDAIVAELIQLKP